MSIPNKDIALNEIKEKLSKLKKIEKELLILIAKCDSDHKNKRGGDKAALFRKRGYSSQLKKLRQQLMELRIAKKFKELSC